MTAQTKDMSAVYSVEPLTTSIGAKITGLDLKQPVDAAIAAGLCAELDRHCVLHFPGQHLTPEEHERFATCFGPLEALSPNKYVGIDATVTLDAAPSAGAITPRMDGRPWIEFQGWHSDSTFTSHLPRAGVLRADIIPPVGGGTSWTNMGAAFEGLSPEMGRWLSTLRAVHAMPENYKHVLGIDRLGAEVEREFDERYAPRAHPVVVRHPYSGRCGLFVNPIYTRYIVGLTAKESRNILGFLFSHIASSDFVYRHRWQPGDIVVWDELATLHLAPEDFAPHPRRVVRVTAGLVEPLPAGE
jgi:taurine dioxygenase